MRNGTHALVQIDGSHGEGGGALVRTALLMSALTLQPARINEVRGASKFPGLDAEDLTLLRALASIVGAETVGAEIGSHSVSFLPNRKPLGYKGEIKSERNDSKRGANALVVLNSLLPVLARSGVYSSLVAEGETFGSNALSYDYFANVTIPALKHAGIYAFPDLRRAGFGRESSGQVALDVEPSPIRGIEWTDRGGLRGIKAVITTTGFPASVAERIASHLTRLAQNSGLKMRIEGHEVEGAGRGAFVTAWAHYDKGMGGGTAMTAGGIRPEVIAQQAFEEMFDWMSSSATTDPYLADQLILPLALAETGSNFTVSRITQRFLTSVWVIKQFLPIHITVRGAENGPGTVTILRG